MEENKIDDFQTSFTKQYKDIENELNNIAEIGQNERSELFNTIHLKIEELEKYYTKSINFLPNYNRKSIQDKIKGLLDLLDKQKSEYIPKKKFGFNKINVIKNENKFKKTPYSFSEKPKTLNMETLCSQDTLNICNLSNCDVSKGAAEVSGKDIVISMATKCQIELSGAPGFVSLSKLNACHIMIGPTRGSVLVEECQDCIFELACQQLRIHRTSSSSFFVHVTSKAIIEECSGLGFAPFRWTYPGIEEDFKTTTLDQLVNNWYDVDDFDWLVKGQHSPNWFLIPDSENLAKISI